MGLETKQAEAEENNKNAINDIKDDLANVEKNVTSKLMKEIEPSLGVMKDQIQENVNVNMRRLIKEELAMQKLAEEKVKRDESKKDDRHESSSETEDNEEKGEPSKKHKKPKK